MHATPNIKSRQLTPRARCHIECLCPDDDAHINVMVIMVILLMMMHINVMVMIVILLMIMHINVIVMMVISLMMMHTSM